MMTSSILLYVCFTFCYIGVTSKNVDKPMEAALTRTAIEIPTKGPKYEDDEKPIPTVQVESLVGSTTKLPCQMNSTKSSDVFLVLWYVDLDGKPIYSFDRRRADDGKRWSADQPFGNRAYFQENPYISHLIIKEVRKEDEGVYRCRVDYEDSPTRNYKVNLSIIVPPSSPRIRNRGNDLITNGKLGPVAENGMINLSCDTVGGYPIPELTWWLNGQLIDDSFHLAQRDTVINDLKDFKVQRHMDGANIECKANNTLVSKPTVRSLVLDMFLRPQKAKIQMNENMQEHRKYKVRCVVFGSKPEPRIEWFINGERIIDQYATETLIKDDKKSISILNYIAESAHNGLQLRCRAQNRMILYDHVEDTRRIIVHYKPKVDISFGRNINSRQIKEGDDVYFECRISAYPQAKKVIWTKNNDIIKPSRHQHHGVIISNLSLVIQNVRLADAGMYSCVAENEVGQGQSNKIELKIKYRPLCRSGTKKIGTVIGNNITVVCNVDAYPKEKNYQWWFHEHGHKSEKKMLSQVHTETFTHRVKNHNGFGTIYCQARNEVGWQNKPCMFDIHPGDLPDSVKNCSLKTLKSKDIKITCIPGLSGGLEQRFVLKVYGPAVKTKEALSIVNQLEPSFTLLRRQFTDQSHFYVFAKNPVGLSPGVQISTSLIVGLKQEQSQEDPDLFQFIVIGTVFIVGIFLVVCCYLIIMTHKKCALRC